MERLTPFKLRDLQEEGKMLTLTIRPAASVRVL
jgi:hypothetical protein